MGEFCEHALPLTFVSLAAAAIASPEQIMLCQWGDRIAIQRRST